MLPMNQEEQQAIALAATIQALSIVHEVATEGKFNEELATPLFQALIRYNPDDTLSAYGGQPRALSYGIQQLKEMFGDNLNRDIAQYLLSVLTIELKLVRNTNMRQLLQAELQRIAAQIDNASRFGSLELDDDEELPREGIQTTSLLTSREVIGELAVLYKQTASQTEPRIMIKGNHQFLQQEISANQIRALLLAALRGAAFFRHNGGKRFDLMMKRHQYIEILSGL